MRRPIRYFSFSCSLLIASTIFLVGEGVPIRSLGDHPVSGPESSYSTIRIFVHPDGDGKSFAEDWLGVSLLRPDGSVYAELPFHSSYGLFSLERVDINGDQNEELLLITGKGRGTGVRKETLRVYQVSEGEITELRKTPYSGFAGPDAHWTYAHFFKDVDNNGTTDIILQRSFAEGSSQNPGPAQGIGTASRRVIQLPLNALEQ